MTTEDHQWIDRYDHRLLKYPIIGLTTPFLLTHFVEVFRSNKLGIPVGRYRLGSFCTTNGVGAQFLELCGDSMKEIEFLREDNYKVEYISEILKSTPNLEYFQIPQILHSCSGNIVKLFPHCAEDSKPKLSFLKKVKIITVDCENRNKFCPTFLEELMLAGENISSFVLFGPYGYIGSDGEVIPSSIVEVLGLIEKLGRESTILELNITQTGNTHFESFQLLRRMGLKPNGLKLRTLIYDTHDLRQYRCGCVFQIVTSMKETLESLSINMEGWTTIQKLPKLQNLRFLLLRLSENFNFRFTNLKEIFPVLQELELQEGFHNQERDIFFPESEPCLTVKSLTLHSCQMRVSAFSQLTTVFPDLTRLDLSIEVNGPEILGQIWSQMTQLKYLKIHGVFQLDWDTMQSMDSILTGIPPHVFRRIRRTVHNLRKVETAVERLEKIMKLRNEHSKLPSIANLTNV